jgi:transcriptional regulator with XRE-family HTH domain
MDPHRHLADNLRDRRLRLGLSQREVAEAAGMRSEAYARYERGGVPDPMLSTLARLARGLYVQPAELLRDIR